MPGGMDAAAVGDASESHARGDPPTRSIRCKAVGLRAARPRESAAAVGLTPAAPRNPWATRCC